MENSIDKRPRDVESVKVKQTSSKLKVGSKGLAAIVKPNK